MLPSMNGRTKIKDSHMNPRYLERHGGTLETWQDVCCHSICHLLLFERASITEQTPGMINIMTGWEAFLPGPGAAHQRVLAAAMALGPRHPKHLTQLHTSSCIAWTYWSYFQSMNLQKSKTHISFFCFFSLGPELPLTRRYSLDGTGDTHDWHLKTSRPACCFLPWPQPGRSWHSEVHQCSGHTSHSCLVPAPMWRNTLMCVAFLCKMEATFYLQYLLWKKKSNNIEVLRVENKFACDWACLIWPLLTD